MQRKNQNPADKFKYGRKQQNTAWWTNQNPENQNTFENQNPPKKANFNWKNLIRRNKSNTAERSTSCEQNLIRKTNQNTARWKNQNPPQTKIQILLESPN